MKSSTSSYALFEKESWRSRFPLPENLRTDGAATLNGPFRCANRVGTIRELTVPWVTRSSTRLPSECHEIGLCVNFWPNSDSYD